MTFELVSLDMAGTTIDEGNTVYETLRTCVQNATDQEVSDQLLKSWTGTSKLAAIQGMLTALENTADATEVYADFSQRLIDAYRSNPPRPFEGVSELFQRLREQGVKVALQTGYSREVAEILIDAADWRIGEDIDALVSSDEVRASRPAPYMIFQTMERAGVDDVRNVLVAGDTPNDLRAGIKAGAQFVVGVLSGAHDHGSLGSIKHTHLLDDVTCIGSLLRPRKM